MRGLPLKDRRILVICPDWPHPSGAVRKLYRHVEVLRSLGYDAYILHQNASFRVTWFESNAPHADAASAWPLKSESDLLVCPEFVAWQMMKAAPGVPKVIFNQGAYQTFAGMSEEFATPPYLSDEVLGTIVVSADSKSYLNHAFPAHRVIRIHHGIDPSLFYHDANAKRRQIAYMPRKMASDARQVLSILGQRNLLRGFDVVAIDNATETQTAEALRRAMIFLNFSSQEGSPLPPLEAMACGCLVIGYDGQGGREYLNDSQAVRVAEEDILGFVKAIESAIHSVDVTPELVAEKRRRAKEYVATNHALQQEREDIAIAWQQLLTAHP